MAVNFLRKLRIITQFTLVWLIIAGGIGLIYITFSQKQTAVTKVMAATERASNLRINSLLVKSAMENLNAMTSHFSINPGAATANKIFSSITNIDNELSKIEKLVNNETLLLSITNRDAPSGNNLTGLTALGLGYLNGENQHQLIIQARNYFNNYQRSQTQLLQIETPQNNDSSEALVTMRRIGQSLGYQLQQEQRDATKNNKENHNELVAMYYSMVVAKSAFFANPAKKEHAKLFDEFNSALTDAIKRSSHTTEIKTWLLELTAAYKQSFDQISATISRRLELHEQAKTEGRETYLKLVALAEATNSYLGNIKTAADMELIRIDQESTHKILIITLIITVTLVIIAYGIIQTLKEFKHQLLSMHQDNNELRVILNTETTGSLLKALEYLVVQNRGTLILTSSEKEILKNYVANIVTLTKNLRKRTKAPSISAVDSTVNHTPNIINPEFSYIIQNISIVAMQLEKITKLIGTSKEISQDKKRRQLANQVPAPIIQATSTNAEIITITNNSTNLANNTADCNKESIRSVRTIAQKIEDIQNIINESEKSIKRLGENSQEIEDIVEMLKSIAEQTNTLALNIGIQAAATGETGEGLSTLAEEIQHLAEISKESSKRITHLLRNLKSETTESSAIIGKAINQTLQVSELAETTGQRMFANQKIIQDLIDTIVQISSYSKKNSNT
ncbi:hypothetical protein TI04_07565 [Achromatium sp. WMS2]|nr:hypothetical protein TI04_07565 [Achromatium sp. WMS2]